jgi:mannose-6-phosphate isomerase-like protein (cupin superfamily)
MHLLENPVTRERFTIQASDADLLRLEVRVPPDMIRPPLHVHPHQDESFQVVSGRVTVRAGGDEHTLGPGDRFTIAPRTPHTFWNSGDSELAMLAEFRPPGNMQSFFETFCGMAREGRSTAQGGPPLLQVAASAREWDMYLAGPPVAMQKALFAALRPLARLRGYRSSYDRFSAG